MSQQHKKIWKDIQGFIGKYQVSSSGQVKSLSRQINHKDGGKRKWKGRILKPIKMNNGYLYVCLGSTQNRQSIHRLVAKAFISNPLNKPCVNHADGNKQNNNLKNLNWVTYSENEHHSIKVLGKKPHSAFINFISREEHEREIAKIKNS